VRILDRRRSDRWGPGVSTSEPYDEETTVTSTGTATGLEVALDYHRAWTGGDFERAMTMVSPDIRCLAPTGVLEGAEAFRGFMEPFARMLRSSRLVASCGEGDRAMLLYDTETALVADAPGAELLTVADGRIVEMRIIFDRLPFDEARRAAAGR
jgi:hypothetical protein